MLRRTGPLLFALSMLAASLAIVSPASADLADEYTPGPCITNAIQTTPFVDVPSGQFYTNAVGWAYVDGIVNGSGRLSDVTGEELRHINSGKVQNYAAIMFAGAALLAGAFVFYLSL